MDQNTSLPIIIILASSYSLTIWASRKRVSPAIERYLFEGNRPAYALSSSAGSICSLSIACTALLSGGYVFGWQILPALSAGAIAGVGLIAALYKQEDVMKAKIQAHQTGYSNGASYLSLMLYRGKKFFFVFSAFIIFLYFAMLIMEFAVARVTLKALTQLESAELFLLLSLITFICYSYVFIGGYRGVLLTDHFQIVIIFATLGLLAAEVDLADFLSSAPSATTSKITWIGWRQQALLHFAVFMGAFSVMSAGMDQWYRTAGTLPPKSVLSILGWSAVIICGGASVPIFIGSHAHSLDQIPNGMGNEVSIFLIETALSSSSPTLSFFLVMSLTCVIMTTLDTYMMAIQQMYHELAINIHTLNYRLYLFEYIFKWREVRSVALLAAVAAFLLSYLVADRFIYLFGVLALSGVIFVSPLLVAETLIRRGLAGSWLKTVDMTWALLSSVITFPAILWMLTESIEHLDRNLYLISAAAAFATIFGYALAIALRKAGQTDRPPEGVA